MADATAATWAARLHPRADGSEDVRSLQQHSVNKSGESGKSGKLHEHTANQQQHDELEPELYNQTANHQQEADELQGT